MVTERAAPSRRTGMTVAAVRMPMPSPSKMSLTARVAVMLARSLAADNAEALAGCVRITPASG
jgi:hypothetical protein